MQARGVVLDYVQFTGGYTGYTFTNATYYLSGTATIGGGGAAFQAGACLKFASNACLVVQGAPVTFPSSGSPVVFTSKDDNAYGQNISGLTPEIYDMCAWNVPELNASTHPVNTVSIFVAITFWPK